MPEGRTGADPDTEREALLLLDDLLDVPETSRGRWIAERTADPAVKVRLAQLVNSGNLASLGTGAAGLGLAQAPLPTRIGNYRVTGLIGHGGMGSVYRATRDSGDFAHEVAIKVIKPGLFSDVLAARFRVERQTLATLQHPNIARLYDGGETDDQSPYIVMEWIDGQPIDRWADARALDTHGRAALVETAARAVSHAHGRLVIHRDITPMNVLVEADGTLKLIDFGIARSVESEGTSTVVDIAGLGKLLARLLPDAPPELAAIRERAMAPVEARYPTAEAMANDLAAWRQGLPIMAMGNGEGYRLRKFVGRNRTAVGASALALVATLAGLGYSLWAWQRTETARAAEAARFAEVRRLAGYLVFDLNDRLQRIPGNTEARANLSGQAQVYLARLAATPEASPDVRLETARGLIRLAEIQGSPTERNLGEDASARENLGKAQRLLKALEAEGVDEAQLHLARIDAHAALFAIHQDREAAKAVPLLAAAERRIDAVPPARRDTAWHLARRDVGRAALELHATDDALDRLLSEARAHRARVAAWPPPLGGSLDARIEAAHALYHVGLVPMLKAEPGRGFDTLRQSLAELQAAAQERPDDPDLLYWIGWAGLDAYAAGQSAGRLADSEAPLEAGARAVERLARLDSADQSAARLFRTLGEVRAQHLSNTGQDGKAIAAQRAVIAATEAGVARQSPAHSRADLAFGHMILGLIARKAGDRALTCASWRTADGHFAAVDSAGQLIGFHKGFLPGLRANLERCARGEPLSAFQPLR